MSNANLLPLLRRWWRVIALVAVASALVGYVVASRIEKSYEAEEQLLTGPINADLDTLRASGDLARTYAVLATTRPLVQSVADEFEVEGGYEALQPRVRASASTVTRILTIYVTDRDPQRAAAMAHAISDRLAALRIEGTRQQTRAVDALMRRDEVASLPGATQDAVRAAAMAAWEAPEAGLLTVVSPAEAPSDASGPRITLITVMATLAGLVVALVLVVARSLLRDRVDSEERLAEVAPIPFLGAVKSLQRKGRSGGISPIALTASAAGDGYRLLAAKLGLLDNNRNVRRVAVIDASDDAGAAGVAAGLAAIASDAGLNTVMIDLDDERALLTALFDAGRRRARSWPSVDGMGSSSLNSVGPRLGIVAPGTVSSSNRDAARHLIDTTLSSGAELVVVYCPPMSRSSVALRWVAASDASVLVTRRDSTRTADAADAAQALALAGVNVSTVMTDGVTRIRTLAERPRPEDPAVTEQANVLN